VIKQAYMYAMGRASALRESLLYGVQLGLVSGNFSRVTSLSFSNFEPALVLLGQTLHNSSSSLVVLNLDNVFFGDSTSRKMPFILGKAKSLEVPAVAFFADFCL
jgi:hypothetical protein